MNCRYCQAPLSLVFADLGEMPLANALLNREQLSRREPRYPLRVLVCEACWLVQTEDFAKADRIFDNAYTYFSSYSRSWLDHAKNYVHMITERLQLGSSSQVIEIASNDGYLLRYFKEGNVPVLGIEPTANTAEAARAKGIETITEFFGTNLAAQLAAKGIQADLIIGNNVLAHVPDINDFVSGLRTLLKPGGTITMEFPHLMRLVEQCQFDTIYHEHFSYLSLTVVNSIFKEHGLEILDAEELTTHGGSLRIYATHNRAVIASEAIAERGNPQPRNTSSESEGTDVNRVSYSVQRLLNEEAQAGITTPAYYHDFQSRVNVICDKFLQFLKEARAEGKSVAAYGAAAKGNTLLNYCGITSARIAFVADASPHKQGKYLPGSHIPVVRPEKIRMQQPNFVVILPWNIREEIMNQLGYIREWGGKFVVAVPEMEVW
jgi:2-polyprenyl-3-methyl-5-hydroxy-6-metoxy-1,4-benzoquinol methylase